MFVCVYGTENPEDIPLGGLGILCGFNFFVVIKCQNNFHNYVLGVKSFMHLFVRKLCEQQF